MLTDVETTDARRFLGYPVFSAGQSGSLSWNLVQASAAVDYRLANLSTTEGTVLRQYLAALNALEQAITDASVGLDTQSAAGWVRNPVEVAERTGLFDEWRRRLCAFLGLPPGPELNRGNNLTLVV